MTHPYQGPTEVDPPPVRVPFGDSPTQTLDLETAAKVLRLMHEQAGGLFARFVGIAVTGHIPGAAPRGGDRNV